MLSFLLILVGLATGILTVIISLAAYEAHEESQYKNLKEAWGFTLAAIAMGLFHLFLFIYAAVT